MQSINEIDLAVNAITDMPEEKFYTIAFLFGIWLVVQIVGMFKKQGDKYDFHGDIYINHKKAVKKRK